MFRTLQGASKEQRIASRYIPQGADCIFNDELGAAYIYSFDRQGGEKCGAIVYAGTAGKPTSHYSYRNREQAEQAVAQFRQGLEGHEARKAERSAARKAWANPLKVGDILYTSWGYDQTNVDFFVVTKVSGKMVTVAEIAGDYEATGHMAGKTWPAMPIRIVGKESKHLAQPSGENGVHLNIDGHSAWLEDGREHYTSSYA